MHVPILIAVLTVVSRVHAEPPGPGSLKLTGTVCTIDGPALEYPDEVGLDGLVVTPKGDVVVLDGAGKLRRYHVETKRSACKLSLDHSFGKKGILELASWSTSELARIGIDRDGTIYVSVPEHQPLRIVDGQVTEMCGNDIRVNASPLSDRLWRYQYAQRVTRETADCKELGGSRIESDLAMTHLFVIDERAVSFGKRDGSYVFTIYDRDGKRAGSLPSPDPDQPWDPEEVTRCGAAICALNNRYMAVWHADGKLIGQVQLDSIAKVSKHMWPIGLAVGKTGTFLLVRGDESGREGLQPARILRVDALPNR